MSPNQSADILQNVYEDEPGPGNLHHFTDISENTKRLLKKNKFFTLLPIQQECFDPIHKGHDTLIRDSTGSGKTLAYCLPLVEYFRKA